MASRGVNKVILLGNLGADPECRTFQSGDLVANFSLATSETWQDRNSGEERERTEWHRCVAYRGLAGVIQKYVKKGSKLYIEGKLQTRKWTDQNGIDRYSTEIIVDEMQMLDSRSGGSAQFGDNGDYNYEQPRSSRAAGNPQHRGDSDRAPAASAKALPNTPVAPSNPDAGMSSFDDDDIPF